MTRRSKESIRRRLEQKEAGDMRDLGRVVIGDLPDWQAAGGCIRFSRVRSFLSDQKLIDEMNADRDRNCPPCEKHGTLTDPIVLIINVSDMTKIRALYACPWCSDAQLRLRWEQEALPS